MNSGIRGILSTSSRSRMKKLDARLLLGTAAVALITAPAYANPAGGAVSTGSASISTSASKTSVNQKSEDVVINWSSFNIGDGQTTQFVQPNAQAIAVNRIGGASASRISGNTGCQRPCRSDQRQRHAVRQNSQVNVGSLIATSTDGSDSDLLAGKYTRAGNQNARSSTRGTIVVGTSGGGGAGGALRDEHGHRELRSLARWRSVPRTNSRSISPATVSCRSRRKAM